MNERPQPAPVSIGLLDGRVRDGLLLRFSPTETDLTIEVASSVPSGRSRELIPAETVAFIGWHRVPGGAASQKTGERTKLHLVGKRTFTVLLRQGDDQKATGFFAHPSAPNEPVREYFFYTHGVLRREKDEPIGAMLVSAGAADSEGVARALEAQRNQRTVPIGQILIEQRKVSPDDIERAAALQERRRLRIGEVLVEAGLATAADIDMALAEQKQRKGKRLGEVLVEMNIVSEVALARTLAKKFSLPFVDLDGVMVNDAAAAEVPRELVAKYGILPVDLGPGSVTIAIGDPLALEPIDMLRFHTKRRVDEVIVTPSQLRRHVAEWLARQDAPARARVDRSSFGDLLDQLVATQAQAAPAEDEGPESTVSDQGDGTIVALVNQTIADACDRGASDIHVEPNGRERTMLIRFRIDGECQTYQEIPPAHRSTFVARLKIMANLDISERRRPQDGKIKFRLGDRNVELRVATLPTSTGDEDMVLRILASSKPLPLDQLKLSPRNLAELRKLVMLPYGLVLCVGPTGSGKTTTLHSALGSINTDDTKIWTAEDPVEITQPGLRQVQINTKIGFTFAQAMRAFLRADPDVIMVGEMRDAETAGTAIEASLTGHLVLSTLHTNSAPETVTRLLDMGLDPFNFSDALLGVLAQRLARALCPACRTRTAASPHQTRQIVDAYGAETFAADFGSVPEQLDVWQAAGCGACGNSGYRGRLGLHELLVTDDATRRAIARKSPVEEIRNLARAAGMRTLLQDGIAKALAGETDMKQVLAVCSK